MQHVEVGNIVLIKDNEPRVHWKSAVIEKNFKGGDGPIHSE